MKLKLKRGYQDGTQVIEIFDGNIDVVIYDNKPDMKFYFYRFDGMEVFGEEIDKSVSLVSRNDVIMFLAKRNMNYDELIEKLVTLAVDEGRKARYD